MMIIMDDDINDRNSNLPLTESERKELLKGLRARLFWVGEKIPYFVEINGTKCRPHDRVWDLINKETLSDDEKKQIEKCIDVLNEKERVDELELETKEMTREEAKTLSDETAGLLRAIMDLREIEEGISKKKEKEFHEMFQRKGQKRYADG